VVPLHLLHELNLVNGSDHTEAQEAVVRVVNEVLGIENRVCDIIHTHGHYLSIDLVVEVERALSWIGSVASFDVTPILIHFLVVVRCFSIGFKLVLARIIDRRGANEPLELLLISILLVDCLLVASVHFEQLLSVYCLLKLNRVLMSRLGHRLVWDMFVKILLESGELRITLCLLFELCCCYTAFMFLLRLLEELLLLFGESVVEELLSFLVDHLNLLTNGFQTFGDGLDLFSDQMDEV